MFAHKWYYNDDWGGVDHFTWSTMMQFNYQLKRGEFIY